MGREILLGKSHQQRCGRKYHIADEFRQDIAKILLVVRSLGVRYPRVRSTHPHCGGLVLQF